MELTTSVEERLAKVETELKNLKSYLMKDTNADIEKLEKRLEEMDKRIASQFKLIIFIYLTTFTTIVILILGLCVR